MDVADSIAIGAAVVAAGVTIAAAIRQTTAKVGEIKKTVDATTEKVDEVAAGQEKIYVRVDGRLSQAVREIADLKKRIHRLTGDKDDKQDAEDSSIEPDIHDAADKES